MRKLKIVSLVLLGLLWAFRCVYSAAPESLTVGIAIGSDDARESVSSGANKTTSGSLDLVVNPDPSKGAQYVGFRFSGLGIPQGANITAAYMQFTSYAGSTNTASLTIEAQAADNSFSFSGANYDISSRPTTTASVAWNPPDWAGPDLAGADQRTPDLSSLLREVVGRPGWASGNSMVFIFTGSGNRVVCSQESGTPSKTASLHVEWTSSFMIRSIKVETGNEVGWTGPTNNGITFTIYRSTNIQFGTWELLATNIEKALSGSNAWLDLVPPPGASYVFYRVGKRTAPPVNRTITAGAGANGSISPSGAVSVVDGSNMTFSIAAAGGYHIADVLVDGGSVGAVNSYNFINVSTNHTISASFSVNIGTNYTITANAGTNGSISPSGSVTVPLGSNQTFTITANSGYNISSVIVDGTSVGAVSSYPFNNVLANHTINASFVAQGQQISSAPSPISLLLADDGANNGVQYDGVNHWTTGWNTGDSVSWSFTAAEADDYLVELTYCCDPGSEGSQFEVTSSGGGSVNGTVRTTIGWLDNWRNFERIPVSGTLHIPAGTSTITLRVTARAGGADAFYFHTMYLTPQSAQKQADLAAVNARALAQRGSRTWFKNAKYGVWFHWVDESTPQSGNPLPFNDAVNAFNVNNFVSMIEQTGAGYVVWTAAHRNQYWPAPIQAVEQILPGHTTQRDLIGEIADGLIARNIKMMLYHIPSNYVVPGWPEFYNVYSNILVEASTRYGSRLSGWWFDFGIQTAPFEGLTSAAKRGNADSLVAWSAWVYPKLTEFQDYYAGEFGSTLVIPTANFPNYFDTGGPEAGLQAHGVVWIDDPWWHITLNTPIAQPIFSADQISAYIQNASSRDQVVTICMGIYQDGTISPASLSTMQAVRLAIRGY